MRALDSPDDPDWSPEDARYSTVRWVASTVRNATGPSVVDPRSGEIIESDIRFFHNHILSYRNRYLLQTGAFNQQARSLQIPEEEMGEMLRAVIAHEIGHALGLPHNMAASAAYPVDSLRSADFTQRMGIAASIMDYARVNYVAQPGDEGVRLIRTLGPYDLYAIEWGYRRLPGGLSPGEEQPLLARMVEARQGDPVYRFGGQQGWFAIDPSAQMEDLGDDPIAAARHGIDNLALVVPELTDWARAEYEDWGQLEDLYRELLGLWRLHATHVVNVVGGVYYDRQVSTGAAPTFRPVDADQQRRALEFLDDYVFSGVEYLHDERLYSKISPAAGVQLLGEQQGRILSYLLQSERMERIVENHARGVDLSLVEYLRWIRERVWESAHRSSIPLRDRQLQRAWTESMTRKVDEEGTTEIDPLSEVTPLVRAELEAVKGLIDRRGSAADAETAAHLKDIHARISRALDPIRG